MDGLANVDESTHPSGQLGLGTWLPTPDKVGSMYRYLHFAGTEAAGPELADEARRLHAEGYRAAGFIEPLAVDASGKMSELVDKTGQCPSRYYLAVNPLDHADRATARKLHSPVGHDYRHLPGYLLCRDQLSRSGSDILAEAATTHTLVEVSALAKARKASPLPIHEIIRRMLRESIDANEIWFFTIVVETFDALIATYGESVFCVLGEDVPIGEQPGVRPGLRLRPTMVQPHNVLHLIASDASRVADGAKRIRLERSGAFLAEGFGGSRFPAQVGRGDG